MDPLETLNDEHRLIERVLSALLTYVGRLEDADPTDLASFVVFFTDFADARHFAKEETVLFEAMIEAGFPRRTGPIATMLREHEDGRRLVSVLGDAAGCAGSWTAMDRARIADTARAFAQLLRQHIQKEDGILYPMARHNLPAETLEALGARFEEMEGSDDARTERMALRVMAEILTARHSGAPVRQVHRAYAALN